MGRSPLVVGRSSPSSPEPRDPQAVTVALGALRRAAGESGAQAVLHPGTGVEPGEERADDALGGGSVVLAEIGAGGLITEEPLLAELRFALPAMVRHDGRRHGVYLPAGISDPPAPIDVLKVEE